MRRREFLGVLGSATLFPAPHVAARNASRLKVWKVGILWHAANLAEEQVMFGPFTEGMRAHGYVDGRNVTYHHTYVDEKYEFFQSRAQELIDREVDIILASVPAAAAAAGRLTKTIPIVFAASGDPVKIGLVASIRRPGGNLTGLSLFYPELTAKYLELLRDIVPGIARVAVLWNPANEDSATALREAERAAQTLNLQTAPVGAKSPDELPSAFKTIAEAKVGGLIVIGDSMLRLNRKTIIALVAYEKLPAVYGPGDFAEDGGLIAYGVCIPCNFRRSAALIDKIFKGTNPGDIPVEQPTKLDLVINLKTAKALGLTISPMLLARADEVIE